MKTWGVLATGLFLFGSIHALADEDQAVVDEMHRSRISVDFTETTLAAAVAVLQERVQVQLGIEESKIPDLAAKRITLRVNDVPADEIVALVARFADVGWRVDGGVVKFTSKDDARGRKRPVPKAVEGEEDWKSKLRAKLETTTIDINYFDSSLDEIIEGFMAYTGENLAIDERLHSDGTSARRRDFEMREVTAAAALDALLETDGLTLEYVHHVGLVTRADPLTVIFCLDASKSVPLGLRGAALDFIRQQCKNQKRGDQVALLVFGREAKMETPPRPRMELTELTSDLSGGFRDCTDISSALRLALAAFPGDTRKRIVLLSDGNENKGSALDVSDEVRASGASIDVLATSFDSRAEVVVEEIALPSEVKVNESFEVRLVIRSLADTKAHVRLLLNGQPIPGASEVVSLREGRNPHVVALQAPEEDFYGIEAIVEPEKDSEVVNNRAFGFTSVRGEPKILYIEGGSEPDAAERLVGALVAVFPEQGRERALAESIDVVRLDQIPIGLMQLLKYDTIVLSNVPASAMTSDQMKSIQSAVRDFGIGLIVIGGENSFGAGGYIDTPIAEALPVELDIPEQKVMPNGALVIVMDTCETPDGNRWARETAAAALKAVSLRDWFGILDYENTGDIWAMPLRRVGDKQAAGKAIDEVTPGEMPSFDTILQKAYVGLLNVNAAIKHIVILSDGGPSPPSRSLLEKMVAQRITVSTVSLFPHNGGTSSIMKDLAKWGNGRCYEPTDPAKLPQIIVKEAAVVRRALVYEQPFRVEVTLSTELIEGIQEQAMPPLLGYVITHRKDRAQTPLVRVVGKDQQDPILAHWVYGLGRSVAFTSDAKDRWAKEWVDRDEYLMFWTQIVRWSMRSRSRSKYRVSAGVTGGTGRVVLEALDEEGKCVDSLDPHGAAVSLRAGVGPLRFERTAPGRYEATFEATEVGAYLVNVSYQGEDGAMGYSTAGVAVCYSPEYRDVGSNVELLERIARESGGEMIEDPGKVNVFRLPSVSGK